MLSTNREKRTEVYPKGTKRFAFFLGFFEGPKNAIFFLSSRKTKSHVRIKRDWQYTFVAIIIVSAFAKGAFRKREREREKERMRTTVRGATTRARKRKIGQRDLWDLIVNNDDICFKHILPRLNRTDLKFLYEVNSETRKLIKRSSRAGDLKGVLK